MNVRHVSYRGPEAAFQFTESLKETGFAVLKDHPIPVRLIEETFNEWADFFKSEQKHRYQFDPQKQSGYFPFRSENAKNYSKKDLKEFFHFYTWTTIPEGMSNRTRELFDRMNTLAVELLKWIEDATPKVITSKFATPLSECIRNSQDTLLRPIHYPPLDGTEEEGAIRAAAHEDINLITLLPAATAPGLEVLNTHGNWYEVPCDPGNIVINSGDMLKMISEEFYGSTTHRVVNPRGPEAKLPRYSMPLFLHPRPDVKLSAQHTAGSYLRERLGEIGLLAKTENKE